MVFGRRWALIDYAHAWLGFDLIVWCETDVPCRLTLLWTDKEEQIHLRSAFDRGLRVITYPKYCFVEYHAVMQNQAGDTTKHTFRIPAWFPCCRRWWMFRGTISAVIALSDSCIFTAHYPDQENAVSLFHTDLEQKEPLGIIDHADDSITGDKMRVGFTWPFFPLTPSAPPTLNYQVANKKYVDDAIAVGTVPALQAQDVQILNDFTNFVSAVNGSGNTTRDLTRGRAASGAVANSDAVIYKDLYLYWQSNNERFSIDWDKPIIIAFFAGFDAAGVAGDRYSWWRMSVHTTGGDLNQVGVGWRYNRNGFKLYSQSHDGIGLESTLVSEGFNLSAVLRRLRIEHDPGIAVRFYLDDVLEATHAVRKPAGVQHNSARISVGAENPGAAQDIRAFVNRMLIAKDWR